MIYITNFSTLLRKILENSKHSFISVEEEVNMLDLYLKLENIRFDEPIDYQINVGDGIETDFQKIPSMVIQPILENSIIHGLSNKSDGPKKLSIDLVIEEDLLKCIVEDNGIGRQKAEQIKLKSNFKKDSLGMQITENRLNLIHQHKNSDISIRTIDLIDENNQALGTRTEIVLINLNK